MLSATTGKWHYVLPIQTLLIRVINGYETTNTLLEGITTSRNLIVVTALPGDTVATLWRHVFKKQLMKSMESSHKFGAPILPVWNLPLHPRIGLRSLATADLTDTKRIDAAST